MSEKQDKVTVKTCSWPTWIPATITAMIGYHIHNSIGWAVMDFIFWPIVWVKWMIFHEVTWKLIIETFSWFWK